MRENARLQCRGVRDSGDKPVDGWRTKNQKRKTENPKRAATVSRLIGGINNYFR